VGYIPPQHLSDSAKKKWMELLPEIEANGYVYRGDLDALAAYASAWSIWIKADPTSAEARRALREMRLWAKELRITRKSRPIASMPCPDDELSISLLHNSLTTPKETTKKPPKRRKSG
jgi:hypothetical protein